MRTPRTSSILAVGLCGALWVGGGAAVAGAVAAAPARTVISDVELVVTPQVRYVNTALTVNGSKTFFAKPNRITRWKVTFGDKGSKAKTGTTNKIPKLTHTYKKTGHYTAKLEVTDAHGQKQSVTYGFSVVKKPASKPSPTQDPGVQPTTEAPATRVAPIAAPSPSSTRSPTPSPTPAPSFDPSSPTASPTPSPTASPTPSPSASPTSSGGGVPVCVPLAGICTSARTTPAPSGTSGSDLAALGLVGLAILSTPVTVATVRRRRR